MSAAAAGVSRRALLVMAGGAVLSVLAPQRGVGAGGGSLALTFDGDALIVAGDKVRKVDPSAGSHVDLSVSPQPIRVLASHPERAGRLFAATEGSGIVRSDDGGRSWRAADSGLPAARVTALAVAAGGPDTVYAAVAGDGLWRSEDAGETWAFVMDRPWIDEAEREVLTLASVNLASGMGGIWLYAGTDRGVTRVPDCFCRWQDVVAGDAMDALVAGTAPPPEAPLPEGEPVLALVAAHAAAERLYAALPSGLWSSVDGGVAWAHKADLRAAAALAVNPDNPTHIVAATGGGLTQSRDGGATWTALAATKEQE